MVTLDNRLVQLVRQGNDSIIKLLPPLLKSGYKESTIRQTVWKLIDREVLDFTFERKLVVKS